MDTNTDLGTGEHTLPALQYWDAHRLFHRPFGRPDIREAKDIRFDPTRRCVADILGVVNCKRRKPMANEGVPRLILNAFCTTCGNIGEEDESIAVAQFALHHVDATKHVVILNGTVDFEQDQDDTQHPFDAAEPSMLDYTLLTRLWWVASWCSFRVQIAMIRIPLWFIRQFGLRFECKRDKLTYKWVAAPDGAFDHWFDLGGSQLTPWSVRQKVGLWRLIVRLVAESEFLVGARRRAYKEQIFRDSEQYYCSQPIFDVRKS